MAEVGIGEVIGGLRAALDLPQDQYAALYGVDIATVERWERSEESPPDDVVAALKGLTLSLDLLPRAAGELAAIRGLVRGVEEEIKRLRSSSVGELMMYRRAFDQIQDRAPAAITDCQVLQRQGYGRLVRVLDVDSNKERVFRIAWGARGWDALDVYSRNGPLIARLMSARVGDEIEFAAPRGVRTYEVLEVAILHRHSDEALTENLENFARADLAIDERGRPAARVDDLRTWVRAIRARITEIIEARQPPDDEIVGMPEAPALTEDSKAALSDRFFMDPLAAQEEVMGWPAEGHVLVEGVAGSGKTSVALGRSAMICMERDEKGEPVRFRPETGAGFVLSEQLVGYLAGLLKGNLNLEKMPVHSYFSLRQKLIGVRDLLPKGVRRVDPERGAQDPVVGGATWAAAVEEMMAVRILEHLQAALPEDVRDLLLSPSAAVSAQHWDAITRVELRAGKEDLWAAFRRRLPSAFGVRFAGDTPRVHGSLEAIDGLRAAFADRLEVLSPWDSPKFRDDRRKISARLRAAIEDAFSYAARYFECVTSSGFRACLERHIGEAPGTSDADAYRAAIEDARRRAAARTLSNADIDVLLLVAGFAAEGYRGRDGAKPIERLSERPHFSHVFIDEVQDFSEVQVRLMAAQTDPRHRSVTAVGDFAQRLAPGGLRSADRSGLSLGGGRTVFLGWNKRQTAPLHALANAFRIEVQGDGRACQGESAHGEDEGPFVLGVGDLEVIDGLRRWLVSTRDRHPHYSIAVLCPSAARAAQFEGVLHDEMWALNILTRAANSQMDAAKLCEAFYVHFTTPLQSKGLEFDAVFAVDLDAYDLSDPTEQAAVYVALTRACRRLGIGFQSTSATRLANLLAPYLSAPPSMS